MPAVKDNSETITYTPRNGDDLQAPVNPLPRVERRLFSAREIGMLITFVVVVVGASIIVTILNDMARMPSWP